ncbi:MAG: Uma2 family endonuclease, partial [Acetobacteraceae bacterium]
AEEFIAWAMARPEGEHYELVGGEVIAMAPERSAHGLTKSWLGRRLGEAIDAAGLPCDVYVDNMSVRIDSHTVYEPHVLVRCGNRLQPDATEVTDPVIVIEILSPSTQGRDRGAKLDDYFRLPSVVHYLIVKTENRTIIHHRREAEGMIGTRIIRDGAVTLDPPGVRLDDPFPPDRNGQPSA